MEIKFKVGDILVRVDCISDFIYTVKIVAVHDSAFQFKFCKDPKDYMTFTSTIVYRERQETEERYITLEQAKIDYSECFV